MQLGHIFSRIRKLAIAFALGTGASLASATHPSIANMTPEEQYVRDTGAAAYVLGIDIMNCVQGSVQEQIERDGKKLDRTGICLARLGYSADIERDKSPQINRIDRLDAGVLSPFAKIAARRNIAETADNSRIILNNLHAKTDNPEVRKQKLLPLVLSVENPEIRPLNTSCATAWVIGFQKTILQSTEEPADPSLKKAPKLTKDQLNNVAKACFFKDPGTSEISIGEGKDAGVDQALHYLRANPNPKQSYLAIRRSGN